MKKKEIKKLAERIARAEMIIDNSTDENEIHLAKNEILSLSRSITSIDDMAAIDDAVQEILSKNS